MKHRFMAVLTALALGATALAPATATARDYRHGGGYGYSDHGRHYRHRDDHGDAVAAGVVGLALGVALGAALSDSNRNDRGCRDRCDGRYDDRQGYYDRDGYDRDADYGPPPPGYADRGDVCVRQVRQWDPYAGRYVWVNLRTYC
ncbi:MAG: hypothetical protein ABUS57_13040 [Pseudomonadota bacterium]